ncbi:MAG: hypothetical protein WCJ64_07340 [Rhodospirillaceae bacterium]
MRCPFCGHDDTSVRGSRPAEDNASIRRRRFCPGCDARFTTFDREKLLRSLRIALRKRPVQADRIEKVVNHIVRQLDVVGRVRATPRPWLWTVNGAIPRAECCLHLDRSAMSPTISGAPLGGPPPE